MQADIYPAVDVDFTPEERAKLDEMDKKIPRPDKKFGRVYIKNSAARREWLYWHKKRLREAIWCTGGQYIEDWS